MRGVDMLGDRQQPKASDGYKDGKDATFDIYSTTASGHGLPDELLLQDWTDSNLTRNTAPPVLTKGIGLSCKDDSVVDNPRCECDDVRTTQI